MPHDSRDADEALAPGLRRMVWLVVAVLVVEIVLLGLLTRGCS
jgi:hypothetical protein